MVGGACLSRGTGCGGQRPQVEASGKYVWEKRHCVRVRKGRYGMVELKLLCFRWLSPFFKRVQKVFSGQAIFSVHVVWEQFQFNGFPDELVHVSGFSRKMFCIL